MDLNTVHLGFLGEAVAELNLIFNRELDLNPVSESLTSKPPIEGDTQMKSANLGCKWKHTKVDFK